MDKSDCSVVVGLPVCKRWSRSRARAICPRQHRRVLPSCTRP